MVRKSSVATQGWQDRIAIDPDVQRGKPVIKGTRVPVQVIIGALASGMSMDEVCQEYVITPADVRAALMYAEEVLTEETLHALPAG